MRVLSRALLAAAAIAVASAPAASANDYCFGTPSIPAAYACYNDQAEGGTVGVGYDGGSVTVPSVCYGVGCTNPGTVPVPYVYHGHVSAGSVTYDGHTYDVGVTPACTTDAYLVRCND